MRRSDFDAICRELGISQTDIARMMQVLPRTVRRWAADPERMYGPAREAMVAWVKCHRAGLDYANVIGKNSLMQAISDSNAHAAKDARK